MNEEKQLFGIRASNFKKTRSNRQNEIAEDYTELIADLIQVSGQARVCDIAREMGISHVSVLKTIRKLVRDGYVQKGAQCIRLTDEGEALAEFSKKKHTLLSEFLIKIGVPSHIVAEDVEGIEHHISAVTLHAIEAYMKENM